MEDLKTNMHETRYTVFLLKNGVMTDYLNTDNGDLANQTLFELKKIHGNDVWICDAWIEFLCG